MAKNSGITRRLKLRDLRVLVAVAHSGSMGRAAAELAISQPAVSQAITELEDTLKVRLFDRTRQGVEPTVHGRAFLRCCVTVFDELRQGVKELDFLSDPTSGELRIGCTEPLAAGFISVVIDRLTRKFPRLTFDVVQADLATLQNRELRLRNVELVIGRILEPTREEDLVTEILFDDPLVVVCGRKSKWLRRRNLKLDDLLDERWILPPAGSISGSITAEPFVACGLRPPKAQVLTFSVHLHHKLLASGRFLSVLPASMLLSGKQFLPFRVLPLKLPVQPKPVACMSLKNRTLSPVASLFKAEMRALAKATYAEAAVREGLNR